MSSILETALMMMQNGYTPLPLVGKIPQLTEWQTLGNVTREQILTWDKNGILQNVGIVCGAASDNLVVLDFDGMAGYAAFCELFPDLAETYTVLTGSGKGKHCYYKVDTLPPPIKAMNTPLGNIEICSQGRQVVAAPSIHPDTGKVYEPVKKLKALKLENLDKVVEWVESFKFKQGWQPPAPSETYTNDKNINPAIYSALRSHFGSQPHTRHGEWVNLSCPNGTAHKHGDKSPTFGFNMNTCIGHCWLCKESGVKFNLETLCSLVGIDIKALGGFYEKSGASSSVGNKAGLDTAPIEIQIPLVNPLKQVDGSNYLDVINGKRAYKGNPLMIPQRDLWQFGGYAHYLAPRKMMALIAPSGRGKTMFAETWIDNWLRAGTDSLVWSPEWTADEFYWRRLQRIGGLQYSLMLEYELWKRDRDDKAAKPRGKQLTPEQIALATKAHNTAQKWSGQCMVYDKASATLDTILPAFAGEIERRRSQMRRPDICIFDYANRLKVDDKVFGNYMEHCVGRIRDFANECEVVCWILCQVNKDASKGNRDGRALTAADANFIRDDQFNLFMMLDSQYEDDVYQNRANLVVAKNSTGGGGKLAMIHDVNRLSWVSAQTESEPRL